MNVFEFKDDFGGYRRLYCKSSDEIVEDEEKFVRLQDCQSELAALREELVGAYTELRNRCSIIAANVNECDNLAIRLTAAEQRNAEYERLLNIVLKDYMHSISATMMTLIRAALKPTESGASE